MQQCIIYTLLSYRSVMLSIVLEPEETTCTTRMPWSYTYREITDFALNSDWCRGVRLVILAAYLALLDRWGW